MKNGVRIINLARAELVDSDAMKAAIADGKVASYVVDFPTRRADRHRAYHFDPASRRIHRRVGGQLRGHGGEGACGLPRKREYHKQRQYFPTVTVPKSGGARICLAHKNIPAVLSQITTLLAKEGINIENLGNGSKGEYAYTIVDTNCAISDATTDALRAVDGMIRVRVIG